MGAKEKVQPCLENLLKAERKRSVLTFLFLSTVNNAHWPSYLQATWERFFKMSFSGRAESAQSRTDLDAPVRRAWNALSGSCILPQL